MIRNAYSDLLYIGDAFSARDFKRIYDYKLVAVVDLAADEAPAMLGRDIIYCRFPLHDEWFQRRSNAIGFNRMPPFVASVQFPDISRM